MIDDGRIFDPGFKLEPYWWEARERRPDAGTGDPAPLPARADVVIVGGGLTGVEAGRVLAAAGRDVLVLDAGEPGEGASSRNAGMLGRSFKHGFGDLTRTLGLDRAKAYFTELRAAYDGAAAVAAADPEATAWRKCGRIVAGMTPAHAERIRREYALRAEHLGEEYEEIRPDEVADEVGTPLYHGGVRVLENGAIQPALYYAHMRRRSEAAGARLVAHAPVTGVRRDGDGFAVATPLGRIACRDVLVATNGYTGGATPWLNRRLLPINAYMVATEPLSANRMAKVLPHRRTYHDVRRRSHYMNLSPDGTRLLFGGRTGSAPASLKDLARDLHADMRYFFPELEDVRLTHAWTGRCAATMDLFPHVGVADGVHYALGYCFSGNAMGPHLARKAAAMILGDREAAASVFDARFAAVPWPARGPWTMPLVTGWYAWADRPPGSTRRI